MSKNQEYEDQRIFSQWTKKAFLHVDDATKINRLKFFAGTLNEGKKGSRSASHTGYAFIETHKLLAVILPILSNPGEGAFLKLVSYGGNDYDGELTSRIIEMGYVEKMNTPYFVKVSVGPGKRNSTGGIEPKGDMESTAVFMSLSGLLEFCAACYLAIMGRYVTQSQGAEHEHNSHHEEEGDVEEYQEEQEYQDEEGYDEEEWEEDEDEAESGSDLVVTPDMIDELEKMARKSGYTENAIDRWLNDLELDIFEDMTEDIYQKALSDFGRPIIGALFNCRGLTPKEKDKKPGDDSRKKFHGALSKLANHHKMDAENMKDSLISLVTNKRTNSYTDLCYLEVKYITKAMELSIESN